MCGIIYGLRRDGHPVQKTVLKRYEKQRTRGHEGFGFLEIENGYVVGIRRSEHEYKIKDAIKEYGGNEMLYHHRMPTSTPNYEEVTHPIVVANKKLKHTYYVVHNGVLQNEDELKTQFEKMGFVYTTDIKKVITTEIAGRVTKEEQTQAFNDSESFAIDLALVLDGKKKELESIGTIAFIAFQTSKKGEIINIFYGRNYGNPLVVEDNNALFFIKSSGQGKDVPVDILHRIDYKTRKLYTSDLDIGRVSKTSQTSSDRRVGFDTSRLNAPDPVIQMLGDGNPDSAEEDDKHYSEMSNGYDVSLGRLDDLRQERELLNDDLEFAENSLKDEKSLKSDEIVYYKETVRENKELIRKLDNDIQWLEQALEVLHIFPDNPTEDEDAEIGRPYYNGA